VRFGRFRDGGSVDARKDAALFRDEVETGFQRRIGKVSWLRGRADLWNTRDGLLVSHSRSRVLVVFPAVRFPTLARTFVGLVYTSLFNKPTTFPTLARDFFGTFLESHGRILEHYCDCLWLDEDMSRPVAEFSVVLCTDETWRPPTLFETKTRTLQKWPNFGHVQKA
jgi:hypothetical protein